jgi:hypothetical protein
MSFFTSWYFYRRLTIGSLLCQRTFLHNFDIFALEQLFRRFLICFLRRWGFPSFEVRPFLNLNLLINPSNDILIIFSF